jgi:hypothetical protein
LTPGGFALELLEAHWLTEPASDLCAHGTVRVRMGGAEVTVDDLNVAFGARGALRTLEADRQADHDDPLLPHACNLFMGCPLVAIDWSVRHGGSDVRLSELVARGSSHGAPRGAVTPTVLPLHAYRDAVVAFAAAVRGSYGPPDRKIIAEEWERPLFVEFWADFDARFARHDRQF